MEQVLELLKEAGVYYLATVEGDQPRVRPFGTAHLFEGKIYIQTGAVKPVSHQILANPKAEICAFHKGKTLRIACELVLDERIEAQKSLLDAYPGLQKMYAPGDGNNQVFYMKNAEASIGAGPGSEPTVIRF